MVVLRNCAAACFRSRAPQSSVLQRLVSRHQAAHQSYQFSVRCGFVRLVLKTTEYFSDLDIVMAEV